MIDAWSNADGAALEALLHDACDEKTQPSALTQCSLPDSDKPAFIAVGLLHFLEEQRLPKLLLQRGYTVQKFIDEKGCRRAAGMSWAPSRLRNDTSLQACMRPARAS